MPEKEKKGSFIRGGLQGKIFRLCILLIMTACFGFAIIGTAQLGSLRKKAKNSEELQAERVSELSRNSMMDMTNENMQQFAKMTAASAYWEVWIMQHEAVTLSRQVQDILDHPENYEEREISPPKKENEGKLALQFMKPEGYEPTEEDMVIARKVANLEPIMEEMIWDNNYHTLDLLVAFPNGIMLDMDDLSHVKVDENGNPKPFDPRERPWWKGAVENQDYYMSPPSYNDFLGVTDLAFGVPLYDEDDNLLAVVEGSIRLENVLSHLSEIKFGDSGFFAVINIDGTLIYSPRESGELKSDNTFKTNIRKAGNTKLIELLDRAEADEIGYDDVTIDGEDYYCSYGYGVTKEWAIFMFVSRKELEQPTNDLLDTLAMTSRETMKEYQKSFGTAAVFTAIVIGLLILVASVSALFFSGRITGPIDHMTRRVRSISGERFEFEIEDIYKTDDEIEILAGTFKELSERTREYIREITEMTAEKERIEAELSVATRIQASMLPRNFPLFPERTEFDLYATMTPAKEVGGDFYDMFLIDDDHLGLVVGDVSGKGVPAALFMVVSKTMIKNRAQMGGKPSEILRDVNNSLCEGNDELLFVTAWLGILTISTGELIQASAGHEYPVIKKKDSDFELISTDNGVVLGAIKDREYKDITFNLDVGGALFMYTDGLPEATREEGSRFELDRMMTAINRHRDEEAKQLLVSMRHEVDAFVEDAPQFDDLTMMLIRYNGKKD